MGLELTGELFFAYGSIITMAVVPIWIGSHLALNQKGAETMSSSDAWKFPLVGSSALFGLYMLFKLFSKEYINMLLTAYFLLFGIFAVSSTVKHFITPLFSKPLKAKKYNLFPKFWETKKEMLSVDIDKADIVSYFIGFGIGIWYVATKHWIANNILGLSFSIQGIAMLSLGSYKVGCILLGGLFFYDVFWVFGTDVMVTVAKSFDAPVKLLFPKDLFAEVLQFTMLGLGDIVIPGFFISLLLKFDSKRSKAITNNTSTSTSTAVKKPTSSLRSKKTKKIFSKNYFYVTLVSYFLGLVTTIFVMHSFQSAQPALLYLVPACIGASFGYALIRGEVDQLLAYEDEEKEKESLKSE